MVEELFKSIADHLPYFGYQMKMENGILKTVQAPAGQPFFWVWPVNEGATFRAMYKTGPNADSDQVGFLRFLNDSNSAAVISRFVGFPPGFLSIEAWYPPAYDRNSFALFVSRYLNDVAAPAARDLNTVLKFFPLPNSASNEA